MKAIRRGIGAIMAFILMMALTGAAPARTAEADAAVTGLRMSMETAQLKEHESITLTVEVEPQDAANEGVFWSSSDLGVAKVDQQGVVTWNGPGTAIIIATTMEGGISATCMVTCVDAGAGEGPVCPACGNPVQEGQGFCGKCGTALKAEKTEAPKEKKQVVAGDTVTFGSYPQTREGTDNTPVEWIVLAVEEGKALLLSRYALDAKPYNNADEEVSWETCSLRGWLNSTFINTAFTEEERQAILVTDVDNSSAQGFDEWNRGGSNTQDRVFLLSYHEVFETYLIRYEERITTPTEYALTRGAWAFRDTGICWWWLRSPGESLTYAAGVNNDGNLSCAHVLIGEDSVRPALWVNQEAAGF